MQHFIRKVFSLKDLKYSWLLLISVISFYITYYLDLLYNPAHVPIIALIGYGVAFIIAAIWGGFNYIGHIKVNALYQKHNDIHAFVSQLAMSYEEKMELQAYLEDYTTDQINQGKSENEAAREAINQFKIKEFSSLLKNTMIFNLHAHYYLGGYVFIAVITGLILKLISVFCPFLPLLVIAYTLFTFGFGFIGMFFIYKLLDAVLYKKLRGE
ncbi:hypothetical protein [Virgibacillus ndiopensis]|uniref:hypothetical protein n=1 Tax=Virgibacillus ndiopensis TaxID=2004408 RepID=UPI000C086170|nr:hypothetical protein [Virgibacillus ndiopensis]